jgi:LETM1 and EF-hand domain-containing protein 1
LVLTQRYGSTDAATKPPPVGDDKDDKPARKESKIEGPGETLIERTVRRLRAQRKEAEANMNFVRLLDDDKKPTPKGGWLHRSGGWPGVWQKVKDAVHHTKMGFVLLWTETKIACGLMARILKGGVLTRRELKQLQRVLSDLFRLVPFSVFVIVPAGEVFLPLAIKIFPNMLPTQFRDQATEEDKKTAQLKVKIEMARFLQETVENMAVEQVGKGKQQKKDAEEEASAFLELLDKGRQPGTTIPTSEIVKFTALCDDVFTLDNLSTQQLKAMCRLLVLKPLGSNGFMSFQIRLKLRELHADDLLIAAEGVENMTETDLQAACRERGMRSMGISADRLREGLEQWLKLHLREKVPASLLLLTRLMYLPSHVMSDITEEDKLVAAVESLPDPAKKEIKVAVVQSQAGDVAPEDMLNIITEQQELIEVEREVIAKEEEAAEKAKEEKKRKEELDAEEAEEHLFGESESSKPLAKQEAAPTEPEEPGLEQVLDHSSEDLKTLATSAAIESLATSAAIESSSSAGAIEALKEDVREYEEDLVELSEATGGEVKVPQGSTNLSKQVAKLIANLEKAAEAEGKELQVDHALKLFDLNSDGCVTTDELLRSLTNLPAEVNEETIMALIDIIDADHDGVISVNTLNRIFEVLMDERRDIAQGDEIAALSLVVSTIEKETRASGVVESAEDKK